VAPMAKRSDGRSRQDKRRPDLALILDCWSALPDAVEAGIVAMVKAASKSG